jgi:mannosyltransferase OCH1-like enzyme
MLMLPSSRISRVALIFTSLFVSISIFLSGRYIWVNNFRWTRYGSLASPAASKPSEAFLTSPQAVNFPFPKKIWQTGPSMDVNTEIRPLMQSWYRQNPDFRYELLNDIGAENYVREHYENNSRVLKAYFDIPDIILRVDLLRYMIMAKSGGVYSDLDTKCLTPVDGWIAEEQFGRVSVVVGVEIDMSHDKVSPEEQNRFQLCQWTLMAMPGSRHFEAVVEFIVDRLYAVAEQKGVRLADLGDHLGVPEVSAECDLKLYDALKRTV